jgi:uncharacterized protein YjbI with pentapeptide repeats
MATMRPMTADAIRDAYKAGERNFRGIFARGVHLPGVDLSGADFTGADLSGAHLAGGEFAGANFTDADLYVATLSHAYLLKTDLVRAHLMGARLEGACLVDADMTGADLREAHLENARLEGAILAGADLMGADLHHAYLEDAVLGGARLPVQSHDTIAEILRRAAGTDIARLSFAGLVLIRRSWCWDDYAAARNAELFAPEIMAWAAEALAPWRDYARVLRVIGWLPRAGVAEAADTEGAEAEAGRKDV